MKDKSHDAIPFSNYPLMDAEKQAGIKLKLPAPNAEPSKKINEGQPGKNMDEPQNWDEDWFNNYE